MRYGPHLRLHAAAFLISSLVCMAASQAALPRSAVNHNAAHHSPIDYVSGRRPYAIVRFDRIKDGSAASCIKKTPLGTVTVYWRRDDGTEDGGPPPAAGEITHPDVVFQVVVISPPMLPVDFTGAYSSPGERDAKWVHLNGARVPFKRPAGVLHLGSGLNIVAIGYADVE
jgi:hypothetical protein